MSFPVIESPMPLAIEGGTVTNVGTTTIYYRDEFPVSPAVNDGSLTAGQVIALNGAQWFATAAGQTGVVTVQRVYGQAVEYGTGQPLPVANNMLATTSRLDVWGDSYSVGTGATNQHGFVQKLANYLRLATGTQLKTNGADPCRSHAGANGDGGWADLVQLVNRTAAQFALAGAPYLASTDFAIVHQGLNGVYHSADGGTNPAACVIHSLRVGIGRLVSSRVYEESDSSWSFGGGWAFAASTTNNSGLGKNYSSGPTPTVPTWTAPSDIPAGSKVGVEVVVNQGYTGNVTLKRNGVNVVTYTLASIANNIAGAPSSAGLLRSTANPGDVFSVAFDTLGGGNLAVIDCAHVEPLNPPTILLYGITKPPASVYVPYLGVMDTVNAALPALAAEFGTNVIVVDANANMTASDFYSDLIHPSDLGHSKLALSGVAALMAAPLGAIPLMTVMQRA